MADFRSRDRDAQCRSYLLRVSLGCVRIERFLLQQNAGSQRTSLVITRRSGRCPRESLKRWFVAPRPRPSRDYEWKRSYDLFTLFAVCTTKWSVRERTHALPTFRPRKKKESLATRGRKAWMKENENLLSFFFSPFFSFMVKMELRVCTHESVRVYRNRC